mmetsp:Transcript_22415/g.40428  ORF Transcript_22415/g.40428 Transcript_22415/m.40428 type:complete len:108 (-) Transcript_22415:154-477(-)
MERKANIWQDSIHELRGMQTKVQSGPIRTSVRRGIGKRSQGVVCWRGRIGEEEARGEETQGVDSRMLMYIFFIKSLSLSDTIITQILELWTKILFTQFILKAEVLIA